MSTDGNVFVFCPTYQINGVDQIRPETDESIRAMSGDFDYIVGRFNPYSRKDLNILNQYQTGRQLFLQGDFSHFMTVEHDMIVPSDALEKLLALNVPVAYGLYLFRHGTKILNAYRYVNSNNVGMSLSLFPDELEQAIRIETPRVSGAGFGCMLVERRVMERFDFHGKEGCDSNIPDVEFATDCLRAGYKQICHFGVKCGHIEPDGNILYPFNGGFQMANVKILQDVVVSVGAGSQALKRGDETELPDELAEELSRAGYVSIIPKEKTRRKASTKSVEPKSKGLSTKSIKGE